MSRDAEYENIFVFFFARKAKAVVYDGMYLSFFSFCEFKCRPSFFPFLLSERKLGWQFSE